MFYSYFVLPLSGKSIHHVVGVGFQDERLCSTSMDVSRSKFWHQSNLSHSSKGTTSLHPIPSYHMMSSTHPIPWFPQLMFRSKLTLSINIKAFLWETGTSMLPLTARAISMSPCASWCLTARRCRRTGGRTKMRDLLWKITMNMVYHDLWFVYHDLH